MSTPPTPPSATPPPPPPPIPPPASPAKSGNKWLTVIIVLIVIFFLFIGGCFAACIYLGKKAKDYSEAAEKNPQMAAVTLAATLAPDIQIVSKDEKAGLITLRNKKTGELVELDLNAYSAENMAKAVEQLAQGGLPTSPERPSLPRIKEAKSAPNPETTEANRPPPETAAREMPDENSVTPARTAALADVLTKFPRFASAYPGGTTTAASLNSLGEYTAGNYAFATSDKPEAVLAHYEKKLIDDGFTVANRGADANDHGPTAHLIATRAKPVGTFSISAESQPHSVRVVINFTQR